MLELKGKALAVSTQKSYATYRRSYVEFCNLAGYEPVPANAQMICEYIAFLAQRLMYSSIRKYLGVVRIMHEEIGMQDPLIFEMYDVKLVLQAVRKLLGDKVNRKEPVDPFLLAEMYQHLDFAKEDDVIVWAICLLGFFGLLRISNMLGVACETFDSHKFLTRSDFRFDSNGLVVSLSWAKNNQFKGRVVEVPVPALHGHKLCPVEAISRAFELTSGVEAEAPAFQRHSKTGVLTPVMYSWFREKFLKLIVLCGRDKSCYGTHSLRRGGASWALKCGLNSDVIRLLGDWKSDAYQCYLDVPLKDKFVHMKSFACMIQQADITQRL